VLKNDSLQSQIAQYRDFFLHCAGTNPGSIPQTSVRIPSVLILDADGDDRKVQRSLAMHANGPFRDYMAVVLTTQAGELPEWTDDLRYLQATSDQYAGAVKDVCAHTDFDWKMITEAGVAMS